MYWNDMIRLKGRSLRGLPKSIDLGLARGSE